MHEISLNLHMHTYYSDGHATHAEIAQAALRTGLDAVIVTDHNVWVDGPEGYYRDGDRKVLLLVGEEIHDRTRDPQKNHLLVFGANRELSSYGGDPQRLINQVRQAGGLSFIAHPVDPPLEAFGEPDISWIDWQAQGYTGLELWNGFSEFKKVIRFKADALYYAFFPQAIAHGPLPETLRRWDELTGSGKRVVAVGGSDAHGLRKHLGPIHKTIFPYDFHFRAINTHVLLKEPLKGEVDVDRQAILAALQQGHCFIGYDLPAPTKGFRFSAQGMEETAWMGDEISCKLGITLKISLPQPAECVLLKDGKPYKSFAQRDTLALVVNEPGVYRVEVYRRYLGKRRGWIFSNPIYVRP